MASHHVFNCLGAVEILYLIFSSLSSITEVLMILGQTEFSQYLGLM